MQLELAEDGGEEGTHDAHLIPNDVDNNHNKANKRQPQALKWS